MRLHGGALSATGLQTGRICVHAATLLCMKVFNPPAAFPVLPPSSAAVSTMHGRASPQPPPSPPHQSSRPSRAAAHDSACAPPVKSGR